MTRRRLAACAMLAAAAALAGCATVRVGTDGLSFEERSARLAAAPAWETGGRLAVATGERAFQARFAWRQDGESLDLTVRGPFGGGVLQVAGSPNELTVTSRGETRVLVDPEVELSELLGWWLPVGSLRAWLLGAPDPEFPVRTRPNPDGTLASLEQRLWRVDFASYQLTGDGPQALLVPRRIDLSHGDLALRVTIDRWRPASFAAAP